HATRTATVGSNGQLDRLRRRVADEGAVHHLLSGITADIEVKFPHTVTRSQLGETLCHSGKRWPTPPWRTGPPPPARAARNMPPGPVPPPRIRRFPVPRPLPPAARCPRPSSPAPCPRPGTGPAATRLRPPPAR